MCRSDSHLLASTGHSVAMTGDEVDHVREAWGRYRQSDDDFRSELDRYFRVGPSEVYRPVETLTPSALTRLSHLRSAADQAWDAAHAASDRLFKETGGRWPNEGKV